METKWTTVELLRYARHDWLNKVQLIKGNISLGKLDRVNAVLDEIVIEAEQDARLCHLDMAAFSELLLTGNWKNYGFTLFYEINDLWKGLKELDQELTEWTEAFFAFINDSILPYGEPILTMRIDKAEEAINISFDFQGTLKEDTDLIKYLLKCTQTQINFNRLNTGNDFFTFELMVQK